MKKAFYLVVLFIVLMGCECVEEGKRVQSGERYFSKRSERDDREPSYPNDFSMMRAPGPENYRHGYHSDDFHGGFATTPVQENDRSNLNSTGIPLDFAKSISDYNVTELLLNYIEGAPLEKPLLLASRFGDDSEADITERDSAQRARPAKCMPELTTVRIIAESTEANVFYFPECTRIERCGGCCSHVLLACQPIETEPVTFSVMKTEYTGNKKFKYIGKEPVIVEKHTKCKCSCKIKEEDCNSYQEYRENECRCVCKNLDEEKKCYKNGSKKLWNPDVCTCQCREVSPCSTGFQFDYNECRCVQSQVKRRYILSDSRRNQPEPSPAENIDYN